jgi:hypothetical protein
VKPRWFALLACMLLLASASLAIDNLGRDRIYKQPTKEDGSARGLDDPEVVCRVVYYYTCSNQSCISSTAAGSCCGDCRKSDGSFSPCQSCSAN